MLGLTAPPPTAQGCIQCATDGLKYATPILVLLITNRSGSRCVRGVNQAWPNNAWSCIVPRYLLDSQSALHLMIVHHPPFANNCWGDYSGVEDALKADPSLFTLFCSSPSPLLYIPMCLHEKNYNIQAGLSCHQSSCLRYIQIRPVSSQSLRILHPTLPYWPAQT